MRRATITIPDDLEAEFDLYLEGRETPETLTALMQAALRRYLQEVRLRERQYRPPRGPARIPIVEERDSAGDEDVSIEHDKYFAEA